MQPAKKQKPLLSMDTSKVVYGYLLAEEPDDCCDGWDR